MARFEPFPGLRYDTDRIDLGEVAAPPYDVIDDAERAELAARHPRQAVHLDLPVADGDTDRYEVACRLLAEWRGEGTLVEDEPSFYVYAMGFKDETGRPRQTMGVIGALELMTPGEGDILPHEHTTPKAKSDRLEMLRACEANLSPIWGLSTAAGLTDLCRPEGPPLGAWTDDDGVHHRLWTLDQPGVLDTISAAVASEPVVIADGHHRYATSLQYRDERRAEAPTDEAAYDLTMALVVELIDEQLTVLPIHRLLTDLGPDLDIAAALESCFTVSDLGTRDAIGATLDGRRGLVLVTRDRTLLLEPRPEAMTGVRDLDSSRLDRGREELGDHTVTYQHGVDNVLAAVDQGDAQAGVLLRPAAVDQIIDIAHGGELMPPKTTFFHPKPRTGPVFRLLG